MKLGILSFLVGFALLACTDLTKQNSPSEPQISSDIEVVVLGIAQDAGFPQAGCKKVCCQKVYNGTVQSKMVSCIAAIDHNTKQYWIIDATPDFPRQLRLLEADYPEYKLGGIFLTHAHIGHYTGLMHLGREVMGTNEVPVYAMPKMAEFLTNNGPWSQLVTLKNIAIQTLDSEKRAQLTSALSITPIQVPHRDEFSETVGYYVSGKSKSLLFIPDIDKWEKWEKDIVTEIKSVDFALLDGSFFANGEIPGRDMSEIPHPFLEESLALFGGLEESDKSKIGFIHFNHTNPVLDKTSSAFSTVEKTGMWIAEIGQKIGL